MSILSAVGEKSLGKIIGIKVTPGNDAAKMDRNITKADKNTKYT